jgi:hypothetical protein
MKEWQEAHLPTPPVAPATITFLKPLNCSSTSGTSSGSFLGASGAFGSVSAVEAMDVETLVEVPLVSHWVHETLSPYASTVCLHLYN